MKKRYKPVDHITVYYAIKYTGSNIEECLEFDNHIGKLTNLFEVHSNGLQWAYDLSYLILILNLKTIHFIAPSNWLVKRCNGYSVKLMVYTDELFTYNFKEELLRGYEKSNYSRLFSRSDVTEDILIDEELPEV